MFLALAFIVSAPVPAGPVPHPKPVVGTGYAVVPIVTPLQKHLVRQTEGATAVVLMNGQGLLNGAVLDTSVIDWRGLRKAVEPFCTGKEPVLGFQVHFLQGMVSTREGSYVLEWALKGLAQDAKFARGKVVEAHHAGRYEWETQIKPLADNPGKADEPAVTKGDVTVYPVRTPATRALLTHPVDAVLVVKLELDPANAWPVEELSANAGKAYQAADVPANGRVQVVLLSVTERDEGTRRKVRALAEDLTRAHGMRLEAHTY